MLTPHTPIPKTSSQVTAYSSSMTSRKATPKPNSQPSGVFPRTMALILSVTEPRVWPGSITGGMSRSMKPGCAGRVSTCMALLHLERRIRIAQRRQVGRPRAGVQLAQQRIVPLLRLQPRHLAVRVVDVAEDDRAGRAGRL